MAPEPLKITVESAEAGASPEDAASTLLMRAITTLSQIPRDSATEVAALVQSLMEGLDATGTMKKIKTSGLDADSAMAKLRAALASRGTHGILSIGKKFKSMDDDGDKRLSFEEFRKGVLEMDLPEADIHCLFRYIDSDCSGYLSFDELLVALKGQLNARRLDMVQRAFKVLDKTGDGVVTVADLEGRYDASKHPDVVLGTKTTAEVLSEFLEVFEAQGGGEKKDGKVDFQEFKRYYEAISASIDLDDYFELVIRNAWHISGGEGWCANTTCKRILVLHEDGRQSVQEIKDDMDVKPEQYWEKLKEQGVKDMKSIALYGEPADVPSAKADHSAPPSSPSQRGSTPASPSAPSSHGRFSAQSSSGKGAPHFRSSIVFG